VVQVEVETVLKQETEVLELLTPVEVEEVHIEVLMD
jgi:hypothetical protein